MKINKINSLTDVMKEALFELKDGDRFAINSSDYYVIAEDQDENSLSVSITLETDADGKQWYSIHTVDEITTADCDLHCTETLSETELLYELVSIMREMMDEIIK